MLSGRLMNMNRKSESKLSKLPLECDSSKERRRNNIVKKKNRKFAHTFKAYDCCV